MRVWSNKKKVIFSFKTGFWCWQVIYTEVSYSALWKYSSPEMMSPGNTVSWGIMKHVWRPNLWGVLFPGPKRLLKGTGLDTVVVWHMQQRERAPRSEFTLNSADPWLILHFYSGGSFNFWKEFFSLLFNLDQEVTPDFWPNHPSCSQLAGLICCNFTLILDSLPANQIKYVKITSAARPYKYLR